MTIVTQFEVVSLSKLLANEGLQVKQRLFSKQVLCRNIIEQVPAGSIRLIRQGDGCVGSRLGMVLGEPCTNGEVVHCLPSLIGSCGLRVVRSADPLAHISIPHGRAH